MHPILKKFLTELLLVYGVSLLATNVINNCCKQFLGWSFVYIYK